MIDWHHIDQVRLKVVEVIPEAPELYGRDPSFGFLQPEFRQYGIRCLDVVKGETFIVLKAWREDGILWYELNLSPPRSVELMDGVMRQFPYMRVPASYVRVKDSGFMEAK